MLKVFCDKPPVASGRVRLTAQQTIAILQCFLQFNFDMSLLDEFGERTSILFPGCGSLSIGAQHVRCRRKDLQVYVVDLTDVAEKEGNVIAFCKSCELSRIVQSNVHNATNSGGSECSEEFFGTLLRETYGEKRIHSVLQRCRLSHRQFVCAPMSTCHL